MATNKVTTNVIDMSGNTGGLVWAKGTTAQRPTGVAGDLRLNTTDSRLEYKDNTDWKRFSETAGTPSADFNADFLVIAGGAAGGGNYGGGGGAGGLRTSYGSTSGGGASNESQLGLAFSTSYTVTIGAGGTAVSNSTTNNGGNGGDSVFASVTSVGGGGGSATSSATAPSGGSGGGGKYNG